MRAVRSRSSCALCCSPRETGDFLETLLGGWWPELCGVRPEPGSGGASFASLGFEPGSKELVEGRGSWVGLSHLEDLAPVEPRQSCVLQSPCENAGWVQGMEMVVLEDKSLA